MCKITEDKLELITEGWLAKLAAPFLIAGNLLGGDQQIGAAAAASQSAQRQVGVGELIQAYEQEQQYILAQRPSEELLRWLAGNDDVTKIYAVLELAQRLDRIDLIQLKNTAQGKNRNFDKYVSDLLDNVEQRRSKPQGKRIVGSVTFDHGFKIPQMPKLRSADIDSFLK